MLLIRTKPDAVLSSVCPYPRKEWVKIVIIDQAYGPVRVLKHLKRFPYKGRRLCRYEAGKNPTARAQPAR